jgi:hypothetical protein
MSIIKGEVLFSSTAKADDKFGPPGNYYVTLLVDEETFTDAEQIGLKCKRGDYKGTPQLTVNVKMKGGGTRKDNTTYLVDPIPVVIKTTENNKEPYVEKARDEHGDVCIRQKELVRGSKVKVSYRAREWEMMGKFGTAFDLKAIQVLDEGAGADPTAEFDDDDDADY